MECKVRARLDNEWVEFSVPANQTILEAALDKGIDLPYSCMAGACTACQAKMTKGQVKMDSCDVLTDQEVKDGQILTCQSRPTSPNIEIEIP